MLEYEMIFGLGFCTAGLLALACLPAVWRRALRLTNYRLRQLVPLSADEIAAEQAGIRARAAVELRRLEEHVAAGETRRSELMADLGRRDAQLAALTETTARAAAAHAETTARDAATIATLENERAAARDDATDLAAQLAGANVALHELDGLSERRRVEAEQARERAQNLQQQINEDRASIAAFETRVLGLDTRVADLNGALVKANADLVRSEATGRQVSADRDEARQAARGLIERRDSLGLSVERLDAELTQARQRAAAAEQRAVESTQAAAAQSETIADLRARLAGLETSKAGASAAQAAFDARGGPSDREAGLAAVRDAIRHVADEVLRVTAPPAGE